MYVVNITTPSYLKNRAANPENNQIKKIKLNFAIKLRRFIILITIYISSRVSGVCLVNWNITN